jgi:ABC-2 type transport system permease protein
MKGAPGSVKWLFRHELKLMWYNAASGKPGKTGKAPRRPGAGGLAAIGLGWLAVHAVAFFVVSRTGLIDTADPRVLVAVTALLFGCMTFMLSSALSFCVTALFERGDLDLLLSSPLPTRSIFTVRLATVAAGTAALYLFFLAPFAHAGAVLGHVRWLAVYPVILGTATIIACAAMLLTLGLVRVLGARRTRIVAQVIGALAGALIFIVSQVFAQFSSAVEVRAAAAFARAFESNGPLGAASPLWLPGRAQLGEPLPVLGIALIAMAAFAFTAGRTHRFFVHGLQQAASDNRTARRPAGSVRYRFGRSLFHTVVLKEWRLVLRDPQLISQVALQLIYLLPLCFVIFRRNAVQLPMLTAALTVLCCSLTASLAWIVVSAEDAPDLLRMSPASDRALRMAKLAAAVMPSLAIVAVPLAWLMVRAPLAGLASCLTVTGGVCTAAKIVHWCGRPGSRSDFAARGKNNFLVVMLDMFNSASWAALGWCMVSVAVEPTNEYLIGSAVAAVSTGVSLGLAWILRRPRP